MKALMLAAALTMAAAPVAIAHPGHGGPYKVLIDKKGHKGHPHGMPPGQAKKLYRRGEHLPRTYYQSRTYYIENPRVYRLRTPPPGYRWVRMDNDVYLVQTRTGLIAEVISALLQ